MDRLVALSQTSSELRQDFYPPIELDENGTYAVALYSLTTYNSIPNIVENENDRFYFYIESEPGRPSSPIKLSYVQIPEGGYEIDSIASYLTNALKEKNIKLEMKANLNTIKVEFMCSTYVSFKEEKNVGNVLGFSSKLMACKPNILHASDMPVCISNVNEINVDLNIAESSSYRNGLKSHTIFSFGVDVAPGYRLAIRPNNLIFLPIRIKRIDNITVRLVDQCGKLVNFRGEEISIQLHIKRLY